MRAVRRLGAARSTAQAGRGRSCRPTRGRRGRARSSPAPRTGPRRLRSRAGPGMSPSVSACPPSRPPAGSRGRSAAIVGGRRGTALASRVPPSRLQRTGPMPPVSPPVRVSLTRNPSTSDARPVSASPTHTLMPSLASTVKTNLCPSANHAGTLTSRRRAAPRLLLAVGERDHGEADEPQRAMAAADDGVEAHAGEAPIGPRQHGDRRIGLVVDQHEEPPVRAPAVSGGGRRVDDGDDVGVRQGVRHPPMVRAATRLGSSPGVRR